MSTLMQCSASKVLFVDVCLLQLFCVLDLFLPLRSEKSHQVLTISTHARISWSLEEGSTWHDAISGSLQWKNKMLLCHRTETSLCTRGPLVKAYFVYFMEDSAGDDYSASIHFDLPMNRSHMELLFYNSVLYPSQLFLLSHSVCLVNRTLRQNRVISCDARVLNKIRSSHIL